MSSEGACDTKHSLCASRGVLSTAAEPEQRHVQRQRRGEGFDRDLEIERGCSLLCRPASGSLFGSELQQEAGAVNREEGLN